MFYIWQKTIINESTNDYYVSIFKNNNSADEDDAFRFESLEEALKAFQFASVAEAEGYGFYITEYNKKNTNDKFTQI